MRRHGFTLVEMLVAIVIFGLVAASLNKVFAAQQRLAVAQVEQASLQSNVRSGSTIIASELWELATDDVGGSDILAFDAGGLTYRAMRSLGLACQVSATEIRIRTSPLHQYRGIVPGQDSLLLWVEGDPDISSDDRWLQLSIIAVASGSDCGGAPAIALTTNGIDTQTTPLTHLVTDAPIRTYETMELRAVMQGTQYWLGARSVSGGETTVTPVAGPVLATGVRFAYLDSLGAATTVGGRIRSIRISLYGESERAVRTIGSPTGLQPIQDSLIATVTLRNSPRP